MIIRFSRHAKRRAKLYKIPESTVKQILEDSDLVDLSAEKRKEEMKIHYDAEVDALYLKLGDQDPDGVIEIAEGINIDTTNDGKLIGIEILDTSKKIDVNTILSYTIELDQGISKNKIA